MPAIRDLRQFDDDVNAPIECAFEALSTRISRVFLRSEEIWRATSVSDGRRENKHQERWMEWRGVELKLLKGQEGGLVGRLWDSGTGGLWESAPA